MRAHIEPAKTTHTQVVEDLIEVGVRDVGNADYEFLDGVRELVETYLLLKENVSLETVGTFQERFNEMRSAFPDLVGQMDAGDHEDAPNHKQHKMACMFEKWLADNMQIDYEQYQKTIHD